MSRAPLLIGVGDRVQTELLRGALVVSARGLNLKTEGFYGEPGRSSEGTRQ